MTTEEFDDLIQNCGYETTPYSGRGMYGKQCLAYKVESMKGTLSSVANIVAEAENDARLWVADQFQSALFDNLGLGSVIYFPRLQYVPVGSTPEGETPAHD